ncbi:MAG TPA: hypothetical protein VHK69_03725, partial [Chitinophagaceae bacterium]|nr:hypothetical protein [Chitinophagaceae bacterium]
MRVVSRAEANGNREREEKGGTIILAGATGALGRRIAAHLRQRRAAVRALVRPGSAKEQTDALRRLG